MGEIDPAVLDLAQLRTFTVGDATLEREIAELFASTAKAYLQAMATASDARTWQETAHALKGSARSVGAMRLAALAAEAEEMAAGECRPEARTLLLSRMRPALAEVVAAFNLLTGKGGG